MRNVSKIIAEKGSIFVSFFYLKKPIYCNDFKLLLYRQYTTDRIKIGHRIKSLASVSIFYSDIQDKVQDHFHE